MIDSRIPRVTGMQFIYVCNAASSGSREMCEYARARSRTFAFGAMMFGAVAADNVEMCKLAREWHDDAVSRGIDIDYGNLGDVMNHVWLPWGAKHYARDAASYGAVKVLKLMIEWGANNFDDIIDSAIRSRSYYVIRAIRAYVEQGIASINIPRARSAAKYEGDVITQMTLAF